jgi:hypothetical protein
MRISTVAGKQYLTRQATTLLKFAQSITDPQVAAALIEKAADLKTRIDEQDASDPGPRAPDVKQCTPRTSG